MTLVQLPVAWLSALPGGLAWPALPDLPWLSLVAVTALSAHYCMARALALAKATVVIPIDFLRLPLIGFVGFVFYSEPVSAAVMIGAAIMFAGNYINVRAEQGGRSPASATQASLTSERRADALRSTRLRAQHLRI